MPKSTKKKPVPAPAPEVATVGFLLPLPLIKVVGVSAAGKSTLVKALRAAGYDAYPVGQEHSGVPTLWKQFGIPRVLIYLDISLAAQRLRRSDVTWSAEAHALELERLASARSEADLLIDSSTLAPQAVRTIALAFLVEKQVRHAEAALAPLGESGAPVAVAKTPSI